jgi:hypothetical protein
MRSLSVFVIFANPFGHKKTRATERRLLEFASAAFNYDPALATLVGLDQAGVRDVRADRGR